MKKLDIESVPSTVMSAIIYPIPTHWAWGPDGWLGARGFRDGHYNTYIFPLLTTDI